MKSTYNPLDFNCRFNGGCGTVFNCEIDYLRHIVKHLKIGGATGSEIVEGIREQSKNLTDDSFAFDCLIPRRILSGFNQQLSRQNVENSAGKLIIFSSNESPSGQQDQNKGTIPNNLHGLPVYELILNRFQAQEDDLTPSNPGHVRMQDILPHISSHESQILSGNATSGNYAAPRRPNWKQLLQNFPSNVDYMNLSRIAQVESSENSDQFGNVIPKLNYRKNYFASAIEEGSSSSISSGQQPACHLETPGEGGGGKDFSRLRHSFPGLLGGPGQHNGPHYPWPGHSYNPKLDTLWKMTDARSSPQLHIPASFMSNRSRPIFPAFLNHSTATSSGTLSETRFKRKLDIDKEYYSSEYILVEGLKKKRATGVIYLKPYVCPVPKCGKSYKNANGIKYHAKYGHSVPQKFPCLCGKLYSTIHSLLAHQKIHSVPSEEEGEEEEDSSESAEEFQTTESSLSSSSSSSSSSDSECSFSTSSSGSASNSPRSNNNNSS